MYSSPELEVMFWHHGIYLDPEREGPPFFVPIDEILSQACRLAVRVPGTHDEDDDESEEDVNHRNLGPKLWVTCGLTKVRHW